MSLLSLLLLKARVLFVDHIQPALSSYDLAISAAFFDRSSYLHFACFTYYLLLSTLFIPENYPAPAQVIWTHFNTHFITRQNTDIMHAHFA